MTHRATKAKKIILSKDERDYLDRLVRRRKVSRGEAQRAEIVLRAADGLNNRAISDAVGVARDTVRLWRDRFAKHGLDGLDDEPRCGAPRKIGDDRIEEIITMTLEAKPADATHWSTRGMAKASGVSTSSVHRIWRAFSLQPHRVETFKLSTDPQFVEKVRDIVGLIWIRLTRRWSSASMRKARSKRSTAPSRCCRCVLGKWSGARMTISVMAPQRCSQVLLRR